MKQGELIIIKPIILEDSQNKVLIGGLLTLVKKELFGTDIGKHFGRINTQDHGIL
jgi:hypothetical protein